MKVFVMKTFEYKWSLSEIKYPSSLCQIGQWLFVSGMWIVLKYFF